MGKWRKDGLSILVALLTLFFILLGVGARANAAEHFYSGSSAPLKLLQESSVSNKVYLNESSVSNQVYLTEAQKKLGSDLLGLSNDKFLPAGETKENLKATMRALKQFYSTGEFVPGVGTTPNDMVYAYVSMDPSASTHALDADVLKVTDRDEQDHLAVAWIETTQLEALASRKDVLHIQTVMPPIVRTGAVDSAGDQILRAAQARSQYGVDGTGIRVGIISDGVDHAAASIASGDLPSNLHILSNTIGGDEGTAMLEIVHDLAPGANLSFHDCGNNTVAFNAAIDALVADGCNIIADDVAWYGEPCFQDDDGTGATPADHVKSLLASKNIIYISAAGNDAESHFYGTFHELANDNGEGIMDFNPQATPTEGHGLYVHIPSGQTVDVFLQWDAPWGSSANTFYLLRLWDLTAEQFVGTTQSMPDDPEQSIEYTNPSSADTDFEIVVFRNSPAAAETLDIYAESPSATAYMYLNNTTPYDSIFGQAAVPGVIAAGATDAGTKGSASPNTIEPYSSQGPVDIEFGSNAGLRSKPDLCGVDDVQTYVGQKGYFPYNPFTGTSAAVPHVAAIAALAWEEAPTKTGSQIVSLLDSTAVDLGSTGFDYTYGYGRVDALNALQALGPAPVAIQSLTPNKSSPQAAGTQITWTCNATGGTSLEYQFFTYTAANGWVLAQTYSTSNTFAWTPTVAGSYTICVYVKDIASTNAYDQLTTAAFTVTSPAPVAIQSLTPNKSSPQAAGTQITWTCNATGGTSLEYQFFTYTAANGWVLAQTYSTSNTFAWTPTVAGSYTICVYVKDIASTNAYDQLTTAAFTVTSPAPVAIQSLTPNKSSPQAAGTQITWTCNATGGTSLEYQFFTYTAANGWVLAQTYSTSNTFAWTPTVAGSYTICVYVKDIASTNAYDQLTTAAFTVTSPAPVAIQSLTPNKSSPQAAGTQITWTCNATGGTSLEYQFFTYTAANGWVLAQTYSTSNTFAWTPTVAGSYTICVYVKDIASTNAYDQLTTAAFTVTSPAPVAIQSLTPNKSSPQAAGTQITWTCNATGGTSLEYQFFTYTAANGWVLAQTYSTSNTFAWTPTVAGSYTICVYVKDIASTNAYDQLTTAAFTITSGTSSILVTSITVSGVGGATTVVSGSTLHLNTTRSMFL